MDRQQKLNSIRPNLEIEELPNQSDIELFQNRVLRPIIKFQNDLLVYRFLNDSISIKSNYNMLEEHEQIKFVVKRVKTDKQLQGDLVGIIMGHLTLLEYKYYTINKAEINKRILSMISNRIVDQTTNK